MISFLLAAFKASTFFINDSSTKAPFFKLLVVDGTIRNLRYTGGCHGNLQALGALLEGQPADFALDRLTGINCKERGTSCSDQLTRVLRKVLE